MERTIRIVYLLYFCNFILCQDDLDNIVNNLMTTKEDILEPTTLVNWPKGIIPFYINPEHFDNEQTLIIMTSLSLVAFKTCLKFAPAMVPPEDDEHVLTFENPTGIRKCDLQLRGHPQNEPHVVILGYDCLRAPWMDRIVVRALGFPFEHNRQVRDAYIDVQYENIEQHAIPLYTKDITLPAALRALPYDINSVMHFGERDYSKNGHRTIIFKDRDAKQKWDGLSEIDLRKIEIIYGPECRERDRQEKLELCHMYPSIPSVDRRKRSVDVDLEMPRSLRVNPEITPPTENGLNISKEAQATLVKLNIEDEVGKIVEDVFRVSSKALSNTRAKFCNISKENLRTSPMEGKTDVLGIIEMVAEYAQTMVDSAAENLTTFCAKSDGVDKYQRYRCPDGCGKKYYSTKNSMPFYSTRNKPYIPQPTRHVGGPSRPPYDPQYNYLRAQNDNITEKSNDTVTEKTQRKKRQVVGYTKPDFIELERSKREAYAESQSRVKRRTKRPVSDESEETDRHESLSHKRNKPKNNEREGKRKRKRPVTQDSEEKREDSDSRENERKDSNSESESEREIKKRKKPERQDFKETQNEFVTEDPGEQKNAEEGKPKTVELSKGNDEFYKQRRWPRGLVPYVIDKNCTEFNLTNLRARLSGINRILRKHTCARIMEISPRTVEKFEDYLLIDNSPDYVTGRVGGRQVFGVPELLAGGQHRQHTAMVVMSMLGFYFELSRHDRDEYVKIHQRHIRPDKLHHFEKIGAEATFPLPYDYESATHPAWMYWRKVGKKGISTVATFKDKDPDGKIMKSLGQHEKLLSESDIIKINSVYGVKCMEEEKSQKVEKVETSVNAPKSDWE